MSPLTTIYSIVVMLLSLIMCGIALLCHTDQRRKERNLYIAQIVHLLLQEEPSPDKIRARTPSERMALSQAIYVVMSHTYGCDRELIHQIAQANDLEHFLLRRAFSAHGVRLAQLLMMVGCLHSHSEGIARLSHHIHSRDNDIRISALTALLAGNPAIAIRTIAAIEFALTPFDIARIIALLRRGLLPIAYEPLLINANRNLRMLGLAIVRSFGIEVAERHLHHIIHTESNHSVVSESIYTLASLRRPLHHARIRERVTAMPQSERKEFCRHLTAEGYSFGAIRSLFNEAESRYAECLINSYKRAIVRPNTAQLR